MSLMKKDYYGKEVADAIKQACGDLNVPQEQLDIEVVETGSTGIFGLRRKKAHIRAAVKVEGQPVPPRPAPVPAEKTPAPTVKEQAEKGCSVSPVELPPVQKEPAESAETIGAILDDDARSETPEVGEEVGEASAEAAEIVRAELANLLDLMKIPVQIEVEIHGLTIRCIVRGENEEELTGQEGKILDSLQYLLRKIVAKRTSERLRIAVDVGEFRQRRIEDLKEKALELAAMVKDDGKTQMIPALNPSERRVVHMILQEDKEIRSRSVGDGLFKKILIYKPGKGNNNNKPGGRKRPSSRSKKAKAPQNSPEGEE